MKKWMILSLMAAFVLPLSVTAQDDDMYFVPTKENVAQQRSSYGIPPRTYYSGSMRDVDEYNRRGSSYQYIVGDSSDVIMFDSVPGIYPDSLSDFQLTREMTRWDGYAPADSYWEGYDQGRRDSWGWHSPWYYSSYYPWYSSWYYDPWYDPWYYSWYGGWYDPWYWRYGGYYSWYRPWYYGGYYYGGGGGYVSHHAYPGTRNHGRVTSRGSSGYSGGGYAGRGTFGGSRVGTGSYGGRTVTGTRAGTGTRTYNNDGRTYSNSTGNFGGSRSNSGGNYSGGAGSRSGGGSFSGGSSGGGGGSFGGSRGGGGGGGGSRGGGGSFGGGRR